MADRESGIDFEILHMENDAGPAKLARRAIGATKNVGSIHKTMAGRSVP